MVAIPCRFESDQRHHKKAPQKRGVFLCVVSTARAVSPQEIFAFLHVTAGGVRTRRALRPAQAPTNGTIEKIPPFGVSQKSGSRIDIRLPLFLRCILHNTAAVSPRSEKVFKPFYTFVFNLPAKRVNLPIKNKRKHTISRTFSLIDCPAISCGCILYAFKIPSSQTTSAQYLLT